MPWFAKNALERAAIARRTPSGPGSPPPGALPRGLTGLGLVLLTLSACRSPQIKPPPRPPEPAWIPLRLRTWSGGGVVERPVARGERLVRSEGAELFVAPELSSLPESALPQLVIELLSVGATGLALPPDLAVTPAVLGKLLAPLPLRAVDLSGRTISPGELSAVLAAPALELLRAERTRFESPRVGFQGAAPLERLALTGAALANGQLEGLPRTLHALELSEVPLDDSGLGALQGLEGLQRLQLAHTRAGDGTLARLSASGLEHLDLTGTEVTDAAREGFRRLPALETLVLDRTGVGDGVLQALEGAARLELLSLNQTRVTDAGLKALTSHGRLRGLGLSATGVTDKGLRALAPLTALRELALDRTVVGSAGLAALSKLSHLSLLSLQQTRVDDRLQLPFPELQVLGLSMTRVGDGVMARLADCPHLTELALGRTEVTAAGLAILPTLRALEALELTDLPVGDGQLPLLSGLTALRTLDLGATEVTAEGLTSLVSLRSLTALDLSGTGLGDRLFATLRGLPLKKLQLTRTQVVSLAGIGALPALEELGLGVTQLEPGALGQLKALPKLTALDLSGTPVGDAALALLPRTGALRWLSLVSTGVGDAGVAVLPTGLRQLFLAQTKITDASAPGLCARHLDTLDVRETALTGEARRTLRGCARVLKE